MSRINTLVPILYNGGDFANTIDWDAYVYNGIHACIDFTSAPVALFNSFPLTPSSAPSADYEVVNKKYVDDKSSFTGLKSGATQVAAGAATNELWFTISHATLPDGVLMVGL